DPVPPAPGAFNLLPLSVPPSSDVGTFPVTLSWGAAVNATEYTVCRKDETYNDNCEPLGVVSDTSATVNITGALRDHLSDFFIKASNAGGSSLSNEQSLTPSDVTDLIAFIKASNTDAHDQFGRRISLSSDGSTLAVGSAKESSDTSGINSIPNNLSSNSGAVYVYRFAEGRWTQQAYLKASNPQNYDRFGTAVSLSADGNTLAVGANGEDSSSTGINSVPDEGANSAGAVYIFRFNEGNWSQEAYVKASNTQRQNFFGQALSLSADGNTLVVGANRYSPVGDTWLSGEAYIFRFSEGNWAEEVAIEDPVPNGFSHFGYSIALSGDGNTLVVGARYESYNVPEGDPGYSGAAYIFRYSGGSWSQEAYLKASNASYLALFGTSVALSDDGNVVAVGAYGEDSGPSGGGHGSDDEVEESGAAYIFRFTGGNWVEEVFLKASNSGASDRFGYSVALSSDGKTLAVSSKYDDSAAVGLNGDADDNSENATGAVFLYRYDNQTWTETTYIKASNTGSLDLFGDSISLSNNGERLAVGATGEGSSSSGVGSTPDDNAVEAGAVYVY
ncbi:hypothetical protein, partial [Veronia pacifica]